MAKLNGPPRSRKAAGKPATELQFGNWIGRPYLAKPTGPPRPRTQRERSNLAKDLAYGNWVGRPYVATPRTSPRRITK